ncbi:MAG: hypothetical protein NT018_04190 [Armatimonadetes bacterium]|nr:hypothetical protein [Armatimonadota bacterium]
MNVGSPAADHEVIGKQSAAGDIENLDIYRLLFIQYSLDYVQFFLCFYIKLLISRMDSPSVILNLIQDQGDT